MRLVLTIFIPSKTVEPEVHVLLMMRDSIAISTRFRAKNWFVWLASYWCISSMFCWISCSFVSFRITSYLCIAHDGDGSARYGWFVARHKTVHEFLVPKCRKYSVELKKGVVSNTSSISNPCTCSGGSNKPSSLFGEYFAIKAADCNKTSVS